MKRPITAFSAMLLLALLSGCGYNIMQANEEAVTAAWGNVESSYQRRADLIPNLVECVKGYAKHEKSVFDDVTKARAAALGAKGVGEKMKAENQIEGALKSIFAVAEAYPELKANENFIEFKKRSYMSLEKARYLIGDELEAVMKSIDAFYEKTNF
jgi:LemA protein